MPQNSLFSELNLYALLFRLFPPIYAYVVHDLIVRLVGLFGMLLLLRRHVLEDGADFVLAGTSVCFALLPHLPALCLGVAGQPLLAHAILNLRKGDVEPLSIAPPDTEREAPVETGGEERAEPGERHLGE